VLANGEKKLRPVGGLYSPHRGGAKPGAARGRYDHETHLPTEEAQARTYARLPGADADTSRTGRAQAPPREGPQAPHGVSMAPRRRQERERMCAAAAREGQGRSRR